VIFFLTALALLGGGYTLVDYFIIRPLRSLDAAALQLADGNLDKPVPGQHRSEIGELARSFETMRRKVASSRSAAEAWARELESRVEQRTYELRSLLDISADISSQLDVDRVLESVVNKCRELLNADLSVLCLIHSERQKLYVASASGPKTAIVPQHIPVGEGPTRCVVGNEHTLTCTGRETCGMISPEYSGMQIVAPLRAGKQVLGALCVSHHQENGLADDASHLLTLLANSAAIALSNAQLFSQAENAAALSERESIATEMHDGLAQMLGYINLQVDQALAKADGRRSKPVREHLLDIQPAVQSAYDTARRMMIGLIEDDISQQSFRAQLEAQMAEFRHQTGLPAALRLRGEYAPDLAKQTKQQLLRIFQESLVNVRRHASASRVEIIMETGPESVAISVGDDGCGFDPAAIVGNGRHHLGLKIMRGRAERVGGKLRVKSKPGEGTTVTAEVPLTPERGQ
jgi:two-component system nitrate/nitrite sensor histidine kinase NarX